MFQRFAAGAAIASILLAIAAITLTLIPGLKLEKIYPIPILWCCVPLAWGVWAVLTPSAWMAKRLPLWGAILGLFAGSMAVFVLNLPLRFLGVPLSMLARALVVLVGTVLYFLLWMLVRVAWRQLAGTPSAKDGEL